MNRRDFIKFIGAHIAALTVLSAGCQNNSGNDVSSASGSSVFPTNEILLAENGDTLLTENGDTLLTG